MRKKYMYLLERIRDCHDWPKGTQIWAEQMHWLESCCQNGGEINV